MSKANGSKQTPTGSVGVDLGSCVQVQTSCGRSNNRVLFGVLRQRLSQGLGARNLVWEVPSLFPGRNSPFLTVSATYFFHLRTMTEKKKQRFMPQWAGMLQWARENLVCSHGFVTLAERPRLSSNPQGFVPPQRLRGHLHDCTIQISIFVVCLE